ALAQMNAASAQVEQSKAARRLSEVNLSNTIIKAPVDGVVISRNVDVGQTVAASLQTPTLFTIAQDLTKMQIDTNVDESDIGKIKTGQDVEFTVDAYPEKVFKGNVIQIRSAPIIVQNVVTYDVVVGVDNTDLKLKPGMTANVSILILKKDNVLKVPNTALRFKPPKEMETDKSKKKKTMAEQKLWILSRGKLQPIPIITGISNGTFTEILEGDIKEGQEVVVEAIGKAEKKQTPSTGIPRILR
ncbi:MAG: efflux RND transporter periplasmic adaptor subunit, partial [Nitrospirae bacterium]|nr:efflux RND transporter periplasmic adaptor subunit [Nitrospirota bacterium]